MSLFDTEVEHDNKHTISRQDNNNYQQVPILYDDVINKPNMCQELVTEEIIFGDFFFPWRYKFLWYICMGIFSRLKFKFLRLYLFCLFDTGNLKTINIFHTKNTTAVPCKYFLIFL